MALFWTAVVLLMLLPSTDAVAQANELLGEWQQLESNSGQCPQCRVTFAGSDPRLKATASNGWSADVALSRSGDPVGATGLGVWPFRIAGKTVAAPLSVSFALRGDRLSMTMVAEFAPGRKQLVKAVFVRIWRGG